MDGLTFLNEREGRPYLAEVPVVVLSAAGKDHLFEADALGASAVLVKPLDLELLAECLQRVLRGSRGIYGAMAHSASEMARAPLRARVLRFPAGRRRILSNWMYRELRQNWGDLDRRGVHSIDEALASASLHRLWQDASDG
jgi:DNA-binding response OmpR family regulator